MLGTGILLKWYSLVNLDIRTGATFVHDWVAIGIFCSVAGHIFLAVRDPVALGGMTRGTVTARWARTERPRWYETETGESATPPASPDAASPSKPSVSRF